MNNKILLSAAEVNDLIAAGECVTVDCRYDFSDTNKAREDWLAGHVSGAAYAHLDTDLSAPRGPHTGRHPLPDAQDFAAFLASIGWSPGTLLVAYDEGPNPVAARLWWLMQYFGQPSALLDGGLAAWTAAGYELESGAPDVESRPVAELHPREEMAVSTDELAARLDQWTVLDARAYERFTGVFENLDTRAGRIPGSLNRPFADNLKRDGRFRKPASLRREFEELLEGVDLSSLVHSCGSGVTACHNQFVMQYAGMGETRVYPGSWSEWITDPDRPIETGPA